MDRRGFLATLPLAALGGCLDRLDATHGGVDLSDDEEHPLAGDRLHVGVRRQTTAGPDPDEVIPGSLAYWERRAEVYAGFPIEFEYAPESTEDADIVVVAVDTLSMCGDVDHDDRVAGCAPLIQPGQQAPEPIDVIVVFDREVDGVIRTIRHELGHLLGLDHDDGPAEIMSNDPAEYIPDYEARREAVSTYRSGIEQYQAALDAYNEGVAAFDDGEYERAADRLETAATDLEPVRTRFRNAEKTARDLDAGEAASVCVRALDYVDRFGESVRALRKAAVDFEDGGIVDGNEHLEAHHDAVDWLDEHSLPDSAQLYDALGLDGPSFSTDSQ